MLTALLFSLFAMLVSGAPADTAECWMLKNIKGRADLWKTSTNPDLDWYVEDIREPDDHDVQCQIATLCKAENILKKHTCTHSKANNTIRALAVYKNHHIKTCNGTKHENLGDEIKLKSFLEDMVKCVQVLYHNCTRAHTPQQ